MNVLTILDQIEGYTAARVTVTLSQKQPNKSYGPGLDISEYMSLSYNGIAGDVTDNGASYSIVIPKANLVDNIADIVMPELQFSVITGDTFEARNFTYGNFKISVTVELLKTVNENTVACCSASNFVIYTNAKVNINLIE